MPGSWRAEDLPNLKDGNWTCKSPYKRRYNCIAWAAGDDQNWWCPLVYWPDGVDRDDTIDAYLDAFRTVGYEECADASLEEGFEKVALFAVTAAGRLIPQHAARQLPDGRWTSKIGRAEDIEHDSLEAVTCDDYGVPVRYMKRERKPKSD